jgi:hypothetical protein
MAAVGPRLISIRISRRCDLLGSCCNFWKRGTGDVGRCRWDIGPNGGAIINSDVELRRAVEGLYQTFSSYPLPRHVNGCPHCVSDADHVLLYSKELRELGPRELSRYSFKAMSTWGDVDDFRHFLPRIFELISVDGSWTVPEVVFKKLPYGHWETWPAYERQALKTFFEALWSNVLERPFDGSSAEECLCCIAQAADDMTRYLDRWRIGQSLGRAKHFASFVEENPNWSKHPGPFWDDRPSQVAQIVAWLRDPARKIELELILARDDTDAAMLSNAIESLDRLA